MSGETGDPEVKAIPLIGVQHIDAEAVELIRDWIAQRPGMDCVRSRPAPRSALFGQEVATRR